VVAAYGEAEVARLLADPGIVRSRAKIEAAIGNARAYLAMQAAGEDFSDFCWSFVDGKPVEAAGDWPAVYAWMQATGLVNDHAPDCFRR
jgi:DNA-3-methyladenine glycosylase I